MDRLILLILLVGGMADEKGPAQSSHLDLQAKKDTGNSNGPTMETSDESESPEVETITFQEEDDKTSMSTGFLNDTCDDNSPCIDDFSLECINGICSCIKNYVPSSAGNGLCDPAPGLNQPCVTMCQAPYQCLEMDIVPTPPDWVKEEPQRWVRDTSGQPSPPTLGKICQCPETYVLQNGDYCRVACKSDEYYDPLYNQCMQKCKTDQVQLKNGDCAPVAKVGQICSDSVQCTQQYSTCQNGKCECVAGFQSNQGQCTPKEYSCPWSRPLQCQDGGVVHCAKTITYYPDYQEKDTCPSDAYCLPTPANPTYSDNVENGICCPKATVSCPVGQPIENTNCGVSNKHMGDCPIDTHYCYRLEVGNAYYMSLCCPVACRTGFVLVGIVCYPLVRYGHTCAVNEQCSQINGVCSDGVCQCPSKTRADGADDELKFCRLICAEDEIIVNGQCHKRPKLGDSCGDDKPGVVCPYNAYCDPNKSNTCQCYENFIPIGDSRCELYPTCRKGPSYPYPLAGNANSANASAASKSIGDYTFCKMPNQKPPVDVVEQCPQGEYCGYYVFDLGLCCPIPNAVCPTGEHGTKTCDPNNPCPQNYYCFIYYQSVDKDDQVGYTCCKNPNPL